MGQLTLRPVAWSRKGDVPAQTGPVDIYAVDGLPEGQQAQVATFNHRVWRIRVTQEDGVFSGWSGSYGTADEALQHLAHTLKADV